MELVPLRKESGAGGRGRGRGKGGDGGRGGHGGSMNSKSNPAQKETSLWPGYVEEICMAIPSFWTLGEPDEELMLSGINFGG
jgi:hypothetical protein